MEQGVRVTLLSEGSIQTMALFTRKLPDQDSFSSEHESKEHLLKMNLCFSAQEVGLNLELVSQQEACSEAGLANSPLGKHRKACAAFCSGGRACSRDTHGGFWCFCQRKGHRENCCQKYK